MHQTIFQPIFLAQTRIQMMNEGFESQRSNSTFAGLVMLAIACITVGCAAFIVWYFKRRSDREINDPNRLFKELCKAHSLCTSDIKLLRSLADARKLEDPSQLLIDASLWILDSSHDQKFFRPKILGRLQNVQRQLFSNDLAAPATAG